MLLLGMLSLLFVIASSQLPDIETLPHFQKYKLAIEPHKKRLLSEALTTFWTFATAPSGKTLNSIIGQASAFYVVPMVSGYLNMTIYDTYTHD